MAPTVVWFELGAAAQERDTMTLIVAGGSSVIMGREWGNRGT